MTAIERVLKKQLRYLDIRNMENFYEWGWATLKAYGKLRHVQQVITDDDGNIVEIRYETLR